MNIPRSSRGAFARLVHAIALLIASLSFVAAAPAPGRADPVACDVTLEAAIAMVRRAADANPDVLLTLYDDREASDLLAAINAIPPVSDWPADRILAITAPDGPAVVGLAHGGCIDRAFQIPQADWADLLRNALGERS